MIRFRWVTRRDPEHPGRDASSCYAGRCCVGGVIRYRCSEPWTPYVYYDDGNMPSRARRHQAKRAVELAATRHMAGGAL